MKTLSRDITITLILKLILLFLLWWVCVRGMHHDHSSAQEWLLGISEQSVSFQKSDLSVHS